MAQDVAGTGARPLYSDFHFHSPYSRAVSAEMSLEGLSKGARVKGLGLLGTGDFSHPSWFAELKQKLVEVEGQPGIYKLKTPPSGGEGVLFTLTNEVATFFSTREGVKKVHHILHAPSLEVVAQLNDVFSKRSNLAADGRPMFASTSSAEMAEIVFQIDDEMLLYPAHAWTPHFGALGSISGYNSLEECYEEQSKRIYALETGMSSDPANNWRVSSLDKYTLLSNSDSHSNHPWRLGRECNALGFTPQEVTFKKIFDAVKNKDSSKLLFTVETFPEYGKYHVDGHRLCEFSCNPEQTKKLGGKCPKCGRQVTVGVMSRVEELADREEGFVLKGAIPFKRLLPLHELLATIFNSGVTSQKVSREAAKILSVFGTELAVLLDAPQVELAKITHEKIAQVILLNRQGKLEILPGFDGEYGKLVLAPEFVLGEKRGRASKKKAAGEASVLTGEPAQGAGQKTLGAY